MINFKCILLKDFHFLSYYQGEIVFLMSYLGKLNLSMTVSATKKIYDSYIIIKSRDLIKLLSRSVLAPQVRMFIA